MNTIDIHKENSVLEVSIHSHFNLQAVNVIKSRLSEEITDLQADLTNCDLIDSEGVIFLYQWQHNGNSLNIHNPPTILFEILDILELSNSWDLNFTSTKEH